MKPVARAAFPLLALLAACAPLAPAGGPPEGARMVLAAADAPAGRTAVLSFAAPARPYALRQAAHRWVAADVAAYEVELKRRDAGGTTYSAIGAGLKTTVPMRGANAATRAVFGNLHQGAYYRAYVTAKGNPGGTAADTVLNSVPATADFDFTGAQDVAAAVSREVTVVFDGVPGPPAAAQLAVATPIPGIFAPPDRGPSVVAVTPEPIHEGPGIRTHFALPEMERSMALDRSGNIWFGAYRFTPDGELTYQDGILSRPPEDAHVVDGFGHHRYTIPNGSSLERPDTETTTLDVVSARPAAQAPDAADRHRAQLALDVDSNCYWSMPDGRLFRLGTAGELLGLYTAGPKSSIAGLAVTSVGDVWVSEPGSSTQPGASVSRVVLLDAAADLAVRASVDVARPGRIACNYGGRAFVVSPELGCWYVVEPDGTVAGTYTNAGAAPQAIAADNEGHVWIADPGTGPDHPGTIYRMTEDGQKVEEYSQGPGDHWGIGTMAIDLIRKRVYKSNEGSKDVTVVQY